MLLLSSCLLVSLARAEPQWYNTYGRGVNRLASRGFSSYVSASSSPSTRNTRQLASSATPSQQLTPSTRFAPRTPHQHTSRPRPSPAVRTTPRTTARPRRNIQPLFSEPSRASENLLDAVFEASSESAVTGSPWRLPPSLMALAAVPGAGGQGAGGQARTVRQPAKQLEVVPDPYLQFMPVPAVPSPDSASQEARRPKDSLNSLGINLNLNLGNTIEVTPDTRRPPGRAPNTRAPVTLAPSPTRATAARAPATRATATRAPAAKAPSPSQAPSPPSPISLSQEDKKKARRKFKRCHGKCVQKFCLPVGNLSVYDKCVGKCRGLCT